MQVGKAHFTEHLVNYLLCQAPTGSACGVCDTCLLVKSGTHPDYKFITLVDSRQIRIEQIREIRDWEGQTASQGGRMVCVINPAERMNHQSSNALLKCLEEPTRGTVLILVTHQAPRLLATIRSRCHRVDFHYPSPEVAIPWLDSRVGATAEMKAELLLDMAGGSPLKVINEIDDVFLDHRRTLALALAPLAAGTRSSLELAAQLAEGDPMQALNMLYNLVANSLKAPFAAEILTSENNEIGDALRVFSELLARSRRFALLDRITAARGLLVSGANADPRMLLEWVLQIIPPEV